MLNYNLDYEQLFHFGCHLGHSRRNVLFNTAWFLLGFRRDISIMDLFKSVTVFRIAFGLLRNILTMRGPVWFVMIDKIFERYARSAAMACGEFSMTRRWIRGAITNFPHVSFSYRRIHSLPIKGRNAKQTRWVNDYSNWALTRFSWPRVLILPNLHTSYHISMEAYVLSIPTLAITDTNTYSHATTLAIPGNDESVLSLVYYNNIFCSYILIVKFAIIMTWLANLRRSDRPVNFSRWLKKFHHYDPEIVGSNVLFFQPTLRKNYRDVVLLFFSKNYWKNKGLAHVGVYDGSFFSTNHYVVGTKFLYKRLIFSSLARLNLLIRYQNKVSIYKPYFLTTEGIKKKFMNRYFIRVRYKRRAYFAIVTKIRKMAWNMTFRNLIHFFYHHIFRKHYRIHRLDKTRIRYWTFFSGLVGLVSKPLLSETISKDTFSRKPARLFFFPDHFFIPKVRIPFLPQIFSFRTTSSVFSRPLPGKFWYNCFFQAIPFYKMPFQSGITNFMSREYYGTMWGHRIFAQKRFEWVGRALNPNKEIPFFWAFL